MAAAAPKAGWIARQWKRGWEEIPLLMCAHCVTVPLAFIAIGKGIFTDWLDVRVEKYRAFYTVMRPDDPRVPTISHVSELDRKGIFS